MSSTLTTDTDFLESCKHANQLTHDHPVRRCTKLEQYEDIHIPSILENGYNLRLLEYSSYYNEPFNYGQDWPSIIDVYSNNSVPIHNCPSRMHQVIWGQNDSMVLRLFLKSKASQLGPVFGTHGELLHHRAFTSAAFPETDSSNFPKFAEVVLGKDQYIFIPETYLVGLGTSSADHVRCLRMCFVDASNLNAFRNDLSIDAVLSPHARNVLQQLNDPSQDLTMRREPKDFTLRTMSALQSIQAADMVNDNITADIEPRRRDQKRRKSSTGKFREWQDVNKWNLMVSSLTLPQPPVPILKSAGRTNMTLYWKGLYSPNEFDKTSFGFNITICSEYTTNTEDCVVESFYRNSESHPLVESTDGKQSEQQGSEVSISTVILLHLNPATSYKFQSKMLVGTAHSNPSDWSPVYRTDEISCPSNVIGPLIAELTGDKRAHVTLWFDRPVDDGGLPILEYVVYRRNHDENFSNEWKRHTNIDPSDIVGGDPSIGQGNRDSILLTDLLPDCSYEFKMFAVNEMGESKESIISNEIHLPSILPSFNPTYILRGVVDEVLRNSSLVLLNDTAQTISILRGDQIVTSMDVWSSYYSPMKFSVAGIPLHVESPISSVPDISGENVFVGKVAILSRDGEPISAKARYMQSVGAIGCIVVDTGKCVDYDQKCFPGSHKGRGEYFGEVDPPKAWNSIRIPVVFILNNKASDSFFDSLSVATINEGMHY